jgi:hypothetical protein
MKMLTRGKSEILKLLRVPRGSVRGKCGWRNGADGASPSKMALGRHRRVGKIMDGKIIFLGGWTRGRLAFTGGGAPEAWDDTKGVLPVVECFSRVWVETLNFTYRLETTRCFIYLLNI